MNNPQQNNNIDDNFIEYLLDAICWNNPMFLSIALSYKSIGMQKCDDCGLVYFKCKCEGGREKNSKGESQPCEDCGNNYCLCGYGIYKDYKINDEYLGFITIKIAKKYLSKNQLIKFHSELVNRDERRMGLSKKIIEKYILELDDVINK